MHTQIIDESIPSRTAMIDQVFRLRNTVFKDRLGWDVECLHGREIDQFDTNSAVYGAVATEHGAVEGCFRLLTTTGPYMLKNVFPELLHGALPPEDENTLESSRFAVLPGVQGPAMKQAFYEVTAQLLGLQIVYCLEHNIHTVVSVTDVRFERILHGSGLMCERYGPPIQIGTTNAVAGSMHPTEENLASVNATLVKLRRRRQSIELSRAARSQDLPRTFVGA